MTVPSVLEASHYFAARALDAGEVAVDATTGNGHDTLFLAEQVGRNGRVFGFDVQSEAINQTRRRLREEGHFGRVTLLHHGHANMASHLPDYLHGRVATVMFNLGYLPGSSSDCVTQPETTVAALRNAMTVLRPGGVATVVSYTGHDGGREEARTVERWAAERSQRGVDALSYRFVNQQNDPPRLLVLEKKDASTYG